ncbi:hypothetical protein AGMMS50239_23820 [Bacteroidia bacterium]|nr:hypothetical protein AGMMS50239_23820 [Bacteroidia bacterium]
MASDGVIADEEVSLIKDLCQTMPEFANTDFADEISRFVSEINAEGKNFIVDFLQTLKTMDLSDREELALINIAVHVIKTDNVIEYSEIKFFKTIRYCLKVSDETILSDLSTKHDDIDLFLGEDIRAKTSLDKIIQQYLDLVELKKFQISKT